MTEGRHVTESVDDRAATSSAPEWRAQLTGSWFDLRAWLGTRRQLLREPALAIARDGTLAFGPVRFALLVWVLWPALLASVIGTVATFLVPPPQSSSELQYAAAVELERQVSLALESAPTAAPRPHPRSANDLRSLHDELLKGVASEADIATAGARFRAELDRYVAEGANNLDKLRSHVARQRKFQELPIRLQRAGLRPAIETMVSGLALLLTARSFRRRLRASPMAHAGKAERAYLYLLPASTLAWSVGSTLLSLTSSLVEQYHVALGAPTALVVLAVLLLTFAIYWRRAPLIAGVLAGDSAPTRADLRTVRRAVVLSSLVAMAQMFVFAIIAVVAGMFLGLLFP